MYDIVDFWSVRKREGGGGFIDAVVGVASLIGGFNNGEVDGVAGLCSEGVEMEVRKR